MARCARIGWLHGTCFVVVVVLASACGRVGPAPATLAVDAGSDRIVLVGQSVPLVALVGGDVDPNEVAYAWSVVARPASSDAAIEAAAAARASVVPDVAGDYVLEVRAVANGRAGSARTTVRAVERGVRLEGDRGASALDAAFDLSLPMVVDPAEVSVLDDHDDGVFATLVVRTELEIGFALDATVGQVNDLLLAYDAWIVDMLPLQRQFIVRVPDPGSLDALYALVARLEDDPTVVFVIPGVVGRAEDDAVAPSALPPATLSNSWAIDHHLALRMHAVWNLRSLLPPIHRMPYLVIADLFGAGPPGPGFDVLVNPDQFETDEPTEKNHGYHVLGIVTGAFDPVPGLTAHQNLVTGVASVTVPVSTLDLQQWTFKTLSRQSSGVIRRIAAILDHDPNARIVVNTSLNDRGHPWRVSAASSWIEKVRGANRAHVAGAGFEPAFVHLTSAGNAKEHPLTGHMQRWSAQDNSFWAYAALGSVVRFTVSYPNLTNVHVIENRVQTRDGDVDPATGQPARPLPGCAYDGSIMGGTLSAMGTEVWSFGAAWSPNDGAGKTGTSMSTPQVAGIAIWAFALAPHLTGPELAELLRQVADDRATTTLTRDALACNAVVPRPVVDAYDVVLAAGAARARIALLDLDGNGSFDEGDVDGFLAAFAAGGTRRYGRHDLNGDGRAGERERTERFDLDGDRIHGVVQRVIRDASGVERTRSFDERALNDDDVLCYYAYGPLFAGDVADRDLRIGDRCSGNPRLTIDSPAQGERYLFTVTLRGLLEPPLDEPTTGVGGYRIYWSYPTRAGTTVHVGWTSSGDSLTSVRPLCRDVALSAQARQSYAPMARAEVSFQMSEGVPGPWRATLTSPAAHTVHVDATVLSAGVTLEGAALRQTCDGPETSTSGLRWLDESLVQLATGPTLHLPGSAFADGGGSRTRTLTLRHSIPGGGSEARIRVVPCSSLPGNGLIPCPDAWPELRDDLVAKHLLLADLLSPEAMRDALRDRLALTFGTTLPEPFPLATPQLIDRLESELPSILVALLDRLLTDTLAATSSVDFDARLADFAADGRLPALTSEEHAFLAETIAVAGATQAFYAPAELGGDDGWGSFPFARDTERAAANPVVPAVEAARGFLHAYLLTHTSPTLAVGDYGLSAGRAAARDSAMLAAVALLVELGP